MHNDIESILVSNQEINDILLRLSNDINNDYGDEKLTVIVILKGSMIFASDLVRRLKMPLSIEFMRVSSYGAGMSSSGFINIKQDIECDIEGKNILIIEDIIDSGNTLYKLKEVLLERKPKSCKICTLLDKPDRRVADVAVEYQGKIIPDEFAVGYGLDYNENYRNLDYIGVLKREVYAK